MSRTDGISFLEFSERWLSWYASVRYKSTGYREYESLIRNHLAPAFSSLPLTNLTTDLIQRYTAEKITSGLSPRTVKNHVVLLRRMLQTAHDWQLVGDNAAMLVALPRQEKAEMRFLTPAQMNALIEATPSSWRLLIALACLTGMRKGEILALQWECVDITRRQITVMRSMRGGVIHDVKTPTSRAAIPVPEPLVALLSLRRSMSPDTALVFCRADGSPLADSKPNRVLMTALNNGGLPRVRFHDLRHSWVMAHVASGTPLTTIQRLGRWKTAQTLVDAYGHWLPVSPSTGETEGPTG